MASARHVVFRIILLAAGCAIAVVIGEALLSLRDRQSHHGGEEHKQAASYVYHSSPWSLELPTRTVDMQAMVEAFSWDHRTDANANSHGFRTGEYTIAHPPDTFRVVVIGDSITWGQGIRREETFPVLLEARLDEDLDALGIDAEVIALGTCGSRLVDNYLRLRAHAEQLQPDLVICQFFVNDIEYLISHRRPEILTNLEESSSLVQVVRSVMNKNEFWNLARIHTDDASLEWTLFRETLEVIQQWRLDSGVPVVFAAFPPFDTRPDGGNFDGWTEIDEYAEILERPLNEIRDFGFPLLDVLDILKTRSGRQYLCVSEEDGHPNALAHEISAAGLNDFLRANGMIPESRESLRPAGERWSAEKPLRDESAARWQEFNRDYTEQERLLSHLLELYPDNPWLVMQMAHLNRQQEKFMAACQGFRALLELAPEIASPWYQISLCTDDHEERLDAFDKMLDRVPEHAPTIEQVMQSHWYSGEIEEGCRSAIELGKFARYPEQFATAVEFFDDNDCASFGLDFWQ